MDFSTKLPKRNLAFSLLFLITFSITSVSPSPDENCSGVSTLVNRRSKCEYSSSCKGKGYLNYLEFFYCTNSPALGYLALSLWLVLLFYVLGNTTSDYFCSSVASLSGVLGLSPTIAGTTLLPLGNGANDVFVGIISFTRTGDPDVGLNGVLGGAFFISCVVVGVVSILVSSSGVRVDRLTFVRDVLFFVLSLCCLLAIIAFGRINLWFALCFVCVYVLYIGVVSVMHMLCSKEMTVPVQNSVSISVLVPNSVPVQNLVPNISVPVSVPVPNSVPIPDYVPVSVQAPIPEEFRVPLLSHFDEEKGLKDPSRMGMLKIEKKSSCYYYLSLFVYVLDFPLSLPRKLTIPVVSDEKWSKPLATTSVALAPVFLAALSDKLLVETGDNRTSFVVYSSSVLVGIVLGCSVSILTEKSGPPKRFVLVWLAGGFVMSIAWTYVLVEELMSLLAALGQILGISTSFLALTVLAWGDSLGDMISNTGMATRSGPGGVQVALSGCYAGPIFNTLIGLGLSLVFGAWKEYPTSYPIPRDSDLYETVGFLIGCLLWALVILPKRNMKPDKFLGVGLLTIYLCFLFIRVGKGVGVLKLGT